MVSIKYIAVKHIKLDQSYGAGENDVIRIDVSQSTVPSHVATVADCQPGVYKYPILVIFGALLGVEIAAENVMGLPISGYVVEYILRL